MGVKDLLNKYSRFFIAASSGALIVAALFCFAQIRSGERPPLPTFADRAFFTTDDGATLFADSVDRIVPFDHDGRPAVRAYVFDCDRGGHRWVQYLEKLNEVGVRQMTLFRSDASGTATSPGNECWLVKKPGPGPWAPRTGLASLQITQPMCPGGCDPASIRQIDPP